MAVKNQQQLVVTAQKQIQTWETFMQPRFAQIRKYEDMYALKVRKQLKNRFNIPLPILSGYIDTFKAKIDEFPIINFERQKEADLKVSRKVTALWDVEKSPDKGQWAYTDRAVKTLAMFSGRGTYKYFAESDPKYKSNFLPVDYYDFIFEPQGGADLDKHLFCGQKNIFKTKQELLDGVKSGLYEKAGVQSLISRAGEKESKETEDTINDKNDRLSMLGLNSDVNNYVGTPVFNLTEMMSVFNGERYYLLFDYKSGAVIRCLPLKEMFLNAEYPFVSWATHEDPFNFMSKSPCDDIYPVADGMITIFNQGMDNLQKRNWGMRGVDTSVVKNLSQIQWRPDGIIEFDGNKGNIRNSLLEIETPDNAQSVQQMILFLDSYLGQKGGINPGTQGSAERDKKVGIFFGEMQQVADRIDYVSKMYREAHAKIGKRFVNGLKEHLSEEQAVKIIGNNGIEWDTLKKEEITDFDIKISGGSSEMQLNEIKSQKQSSALDRLQANPNLSSAINPKWLTETILRQGDFEEDEIRTALDVASEGNEEIMSEAAKAIDDILSKRTPERNRGATTGFIQKIIDYAIDKVPEKDQEVFDKLMAYANLHVQIAADNAVRKLGQIKTSQAQDSLANPETPGGGMPGQSGQPAPMQSSAGVASRSQGMTNNVTPVV